MTWIFWKIFVWHLNVKNTKNVHSTLENLFEMLMSMCMWMLNEHIVHLTWIFLSMFFQHVFITCWMDMSNEHQFVSMKILFVSVFTHLWCLVSGHYYLINIIENLITILQKNTIECDPMFNNQIDDNNFILNMLGMMKHVI